MPRALSSAERRPSRRSETCMRGRHRCTSVHQRALLHAQLCGSCELASRVVANLQVRL